MRRAAVTEAAGERRRKRMMTEEILTRLLGGEPVSGQTLSEELGVTRAAVWKQNRPASRGGV